MVGAGRTSTKCQAAASFVAVICFGALCLSDELARVALFFLEAQTHTESYSLLLVPTLVVFTSEPQALRWRAMSRGFMWAAPAFFSSIRPGKDIFENSRFQ